MEKNFRNKYVFQLDELLVMIGLITMNVETWLLAVVEPRVFYYMKLATIFIFILSVFVRKHNFYRFLKIFLLMILAIIVFIRSNDDLLLYFSIAMLISGNLKVHTIAKIDFHTKIVCICLVALCYFAKIIPSYDDIKTAGGVAYSLGYYNPNSLFFGAFSILVDFIILKGKMLRPINYLVIAIIGIFFSEITDCRTGFFALALLLLLVYFDNRILLLKRFKIARVGIVFSTPICCIVSVVLVLLYNTVPFIAQISLLLSDRIRYAVTVWNNYKVGLFGNDVVTNTALQALQNNGRTAYPLDNYYLYSLLAYGILFSFIIFFMAVVGELKLIRNGKTIIAIVFAVLAVYSLMEKFYISFESNVWVLLLMSAFFSDDEIRSLY